jgi:hypothetical protein
MPFYEVTAIARFLLGSDAYHTIERAATGSSDPASATGQLLRIDLIAIQSLCEIALKLFADPCPMCSRFQRDPRSRVWFGTYLDQTLLHLC